MTPISLTISFVLAFLATCAYSVPVISDLQNATSVVPVENATVDFRLEDVVLMVDPNNATIAVATVSRQEQLPGSAGKRNNGKADLSSSSSEGNSNEINQTTEKLSPRDYENDASSASEEERSVTDDPLATETNTKRGIEAESFESSTVVNQSSTVDGTSIPTPSQVKNNKRAFDGSWALDDSDAEAKNDKRALDGSWSMADSDDEAKKDKRALDGSWSMGDSDDESKKDKRALDDSWSMADSDEEAKTAKRSLDGSWSMAEGNGGVQKRSVGSIESSTGDYQTTAIGETSVPSTSEMNVPKRDVEQSSAVTAEEKEAFHRRAIGSMQSADEERPMKREMEPSSSSDSESNDEFNRRAMSRLRRPRKMHSMKREMEQSPSYDDQAEDELNERAVGTVETVQVDASSTVITKKIQGESSTEEQPSSSTSVEYNQSSSTSDYETTVASMNDLTSVSSVPSESRSKILAVIPGKISRTQYVVQPVDQLRLSQGQNQSVVEEKKPNY